MTYIESMTLSERMKSFEVVSKNHLTRKTPVILRVDGKAFHTFTKPLTKPFDTALSDAMIHTTQTLCENVQGAVCGYTQSDEISILIQDWKNLNTDCWFGYNIQKMASVAASIATAAFNSHFTHPDKMYALFDARVFNIPVHEITNYFIWRQQDCIRNSIQSVGISKFTQSELHGKNCDDIQNMLSDMHNIKWGDVPTRHRHGTCVVDNIGWHIDTELPKFTSDRKYIETLFNFKDET